jgi:hypothetical protein
MDRGSEIVRQWRDWAADLQPQGRDARLWEKFQAEGIGSKIYLVAGIAANLHQAWINHSTTTSSSPRTPTGYAPSCIAAISLFEQNRLHETCESDHMTAIKEMLNEELPLPANVLVDVYDLSHEHATIEMFYRATHGRQPVPTAMHTALFWAPASPTAYTLGLNLVYNPLVTRWKDICLRCPFQNHYFCNTEKWVASPCELGARSLRQNLHPQKVPSSVAANKYANIANLTNVVWSEIDEVPVGYKHASMTPQVQTHELNSKNALIRQDSTCKGFNDPPGNHDLRPDRFYHKWQLCTTCYCRKRLQEKRVKLWNVRLQELESWRNRPTAGAS